MQNSYSARSSPYFGRRSQASEESFRCLQELHYYRIRQGQFNICMSSLRLLDQLVRSFRRHPPGGGFEPRRGRIYSTWGKKTPRCAPVCLGWLVRHWAVDSDPVERCRLGAGPTLGGGSSGRWNGAARPKPGKSRVSGGFSAGVNLASS